MRQAMMLAGAVVLASAATQAAPGPQAPPPVKDSKALKAEARQFAQQIHYLVLQITSQYARPVAREELLEVGLRGLYQAARRPAPADLRGRIRQAVSLAGTLQAQQGMRPAGNFDRPIDDPVEKLLIRLYEELGRPEALVGQRPVVLVARALARLLDPHSGVVTAEEQRRSVGQDLDRIGVGLECREQLALGPLHVETVHPGGPAQRAGLRPGDAITHLDGQPVEKADPPGVLALKNGPALDDITHLARPNDPATPADLPRLLRLTYRRPGEAAPRTATLLRERFRPESVLGARRREDNRWDYLLDERRGIGYVRLAQLSRGTSEELREVLTQLQAREARGVVLDLRWCPGGYLNEAVETADLFLGKGVIATVKNRGREDTVYRSTDDASFRALAVAVLVNGETSGGAELIAAAIQDHKRGVIVGQRTLGKASVQTPLPLGVEGVGFKLTSGTFTRPSDANLHRFSDSGPDEDWGVRPDEDARVSPELGKRLKSWWTVQALRPGRSAERLPLDDPLADPQQQAAAAAVLRQLSRPAAARR